MINHRSSKGILISSLKFYGLSSVVRTLDRRNKFMCPVCGSTNKVFFNCHAGFDLTFDLTIHKDIKSNPGPIASLMEGIWQEHIVNPVTTL